MQMRLLFWSLRHRRWRHLLNAITIAVTVSVVMVFATVMFDLLSFVRSSADRELTRVMIIPKMLGTELPLSMARDRKSVV